MAARKGKADAGAKSKPARTPAKKAEVRTVDAEGVEVVEGGGLTFEDGITITTTLLLIGSLVLVVMALGRYPG